MMSRGNRVIFNQDGKIIYETGEMFGHVLPHEEITRLYHVDLEYGTIDYSKYRIVAIDVETMEPIIEKLPVNETEDQKRIRELEDILLLSIDAELGGIL
ncbi:hypothetical protein [Metasolibacillus sp. FSL K6-0083]|uniref:hypothetical protein n=1 Tax=Metasolibacillus sp. FSL K6-0083 TaxID=2921416 RepID=UPI003159B121